MTPYREPTPLEPLPSPSDETLARLGVYPGDFVNALQAYRLHVGTGVCLLEDVKNRARKRLPMVSMNENERDTFRDALRWIEGLTFRTIQRWEYRRHEASVTRTPAVPARPGAKLRLVLSSVVTGAVVGATFGHGTGMVAGAALGLVIGWFVHGALAAA